MVKCTKNVLIVLTRGIPFSLYSLPYTYSMKFSRPFFIAIICLFCSSSYGQISLNTSGGDAFSSQGSVAYSIGQVFVQISESPEISVSEGVQQAYEISLYNAIPEASALEVSILAYPNPTMNDLNIELQGWRHEKASFEVYDAQGKKVSAGDFNQSTLSIDARLWSSGNYFLHIYSPDGEQAASVKIIKTS